MDENASDEEALAHQAAVYHADAAEQAADAAEQGWDDPTAARAEAERHAAAAKAARPGSVWHGIAEAAAERARRTETWSRDLA